MFDVSRQKPRWLPSPNQLQWTWWSLVPWFLAAPLGRTQRKLPKVTSTTYLNGLRGIACISVLNYHLCLLFNAAAVVNPYGADPPGTNIEMLQLPILRLFWAGRAGVALFFVLSGFVLSYSFLRKVESGVISANDLFISLNSSIIRRPIRIFLPMFITVAITACYTHSNPNPSLLTPSWTARYPDGPGSPAYPSFPVFLWRQLYWTVPVMNPFMWDWHLPPPSGPHLWTLPVEYRLSLFIFFMCLLTWRLPSTSRKVVIAFVGMWANLNYHWDVSAFSFGMLIADFRVRPLSLEFATRSFDQRVLQGIRTGFLCVLLLISLVFLSWPDNFGSVTAPYRHFAWMGLPRHQEGTEDPQYYFQSIGSAGLIIFLENTPSAQAIFTNVVFRYLGEISFAFYLLHELVIFAVGLRVMESIPGTLGWNRDQCFFLIYLSIFGTIVCSADLFWRGIDEKCVQLGKYVVSRVTIQSPSENSLPLAQTVGLESLPLTINDTGRETEY